MKFTHNQRTDCQIITSNLNRSKAECLLQKDIVEEINGLSGIQYDKKIVDALMEIIEEDNEI